MDEMIVRVAKEYLRSDSSSTSTSPGGGGTGCDEVVAVTTHWEEDVPWSLDEDLGVFKWFKLGGGKVNKEFARNASLLSEHSQKYFKYELPQVEDLCYLNSSVFECPHSLIGYIYAQWCIWVYAVGPLKRRATGMSVMKGDDNARYRWAASVKPEDDLEVEVIATDIVSIIFTLFLCILL
ncbi:hypothetical protein C8R41DRAFT_903132 [Lentinula lateritia]|uniref:Uncharacterized protein n=1 Tax=Lentinula lateritia TaxID=40482 RepID=A0ABQ8VFM9_9AGAR|nr:hypothetical protein C8R41DRAFT_903132 [Lentinula lateritia]